MPNRKSNPGYGKAFTFHGSFNSLILARRREREIPGSFIVERNKRYYVLRPKKIRSNPYVLKSGEYYYAGLDRFSKDLKHAIKIKKASQAVKIRRRLEDRSPRDPFRMRVKRVKPNPRRGILIYGRVLKIFAQKTSGPYKGQRFVHAFKRGALMYGLPDGSLRIVHS